MSNFDLLNWVRFLKIPDFKGIFSRDSKDHLHKNRSCIINLDDGIGPGTHWVATKIKGKKVFYFDSLSIHAPVEFVEYAQKIEKEIIYNSGYPIQDFLSVRCGYYCLYFQEEIQSKSFYDVLKVFSLNDPGKNERFIKQYFLEKNRMRSYCVKQRKVTECVQPSGYKTAKNGRPMFWCRKSQMPGN